jgi:tetratricopeptide (TPR) repeat protein
MSSIAVRRYRPTGPKEGLRLVLTSLAVASISVAATACGSSSKSGTQLSADYTSAGLRAQSAGRTSEAVDDYNKAIAQDPKNKIAYYDLGLIQQTTGQLTAAEHNYRVALQIDPDFTLALFNLAIIRTGPSPTEAVELYRHVLVNQPGSAGAHLNLGFVLLSLGRASEAKTEFAAAVQIDPGLAGRVPSTAPSPVPSASTHP